MSGRWLDERKTMLFRDLVSGYFENRLFFRDVLKTHKKTGRLRYSIIEHWVGTETRKGKLWIFKDRCHRLLRSDKEWESILEYLYRIRPHGPLLGQVLHDRFRLVTKLDLEVSERTLLTAAMTHKSAVLTVDV